jgi:hypothetical protein
MCKSLAALSSLAGSLVSSPRFAAFDRLVQLKQLEWPRSSLATQARPWVQLPRQRNSHQLLVPNIVLSQVVGKAWQSSFEALVQRKLALRTKSVE